MVNTTSHAKQVRNNVSPRFFQKEWNLVLLHTGDDKLALSPTESDIILVVIKVRLRGQVREDTAIRAARCRNLFKGWQFSLSLFYTFVTNFMRFFKVTASKMRRLSVAVAGLGLAVLGK